MSPVPDGARVSFLGLGRPIVRNVAAAGFRVKLWNRTRSVAVQLADDLGAEIAETPVEPASGADVAMVMVADDAAADAVYLGGDGLVGGLLAGQVVIDLSSAIAAPVVHYRRAAFERPGERPVSFRLALGTKDLRLISDLAREVGAPMPQAMCNLQTMAAESGFADWDLAGLAEWLRRTPDGGR